MSDGLVTRIGKWIDNKWESKATESELRFRFKSLEDAAINDKLELEGRITAAQLAFVADLSKVQADLKMALEALSSNGQEKEKEIAELKTRLEKLELYSGMTRKVDPTKPPVARSAFSM
jgi:hypothetical protein